MSLCIGVTRYMSIVGLNKMTTLGDLRCIELCYVFMSCDGVHMTCIAVSRAPSTQSHPQSMWTREHCELIESPSWKEELPTVCVCWRVGRCYVMYRWLSCTQTPKLLVPTQTWGRYVDTHLPLCVRVWRDLIGKPPRHSIHLFIVTCAGGSKVPPIHLIT